MASRTPGLEAQHANARAALLALHRRAVAAVAAVALSRRRDQGADGRPGDRTADRADAHGARRGAHRSHARRDRADAGCSKAASSITKARPRRARSSGARPAAGMWRARPTARCCSASSRSPTSSSSGAAAARCAPPGAPQPAIPARPAGASPPREATDCVPSASKEFAHVKFGDFAKIKSLQTTTGFKENLQRLGLPMPCDDIVASGPESPLGSPLQAGPFTIGNRFAIQPMEGWDCHEDGRPSDNTIRRWRHFGLSGAKLIWGGEAVAVRHDGRANPNQLMMTRGQPGRASRSCARRSSPRTARRWATTTDWSSACSSRTRAASASPTARRGWSRSSCTGIRSSTASSRWRPIIRCSPTATSAQLIDDYVIAAKRALGLRLPVRRPQALPRLPRPRVPVGQDARGRLRRLAREPHALPARTGGGHPRRGAGTGNRRARVGAGPRAVQARSRAVGTRFARSRRAGRLHAMPALSLRLRHRRERSGPRPTPRRRARSSRSCRAWASSSSTSRWAAPTTTRT